MVVALTWLAIILGAFSWALSDKARLVAEIHGVHSGEAYSATEEKRRQD